MAEKYNATCSICGRPYYKCISCKDTMALNPWKAFCCSSQHYKVHQVIRGFNGNVYTKDEAKNKLKNINISDVDIDNFKPNIKQIVKDILKEEKSVAESIVADVAEEKSEVSVKQTYSRKRNYKTNNEVKEVIEAE